MDAGHHFLCGAFRAFGQKGRRELADSDIRAKGKERMGGLGHSGGVRTHSGVQALGLK